LYICSKLFNIKKIYLVITLIIYSVVLFSQTPIANAGNDTLICGFSGNLNAIPSVENGFWDCSNYKCIIIHDINDPNTEIETHVINTNNPSTPYFEFIWTEISGEETDSDTVKVIFARVPDSSIDIIPAKCFGEPFSIKAYEDSLLNYIWDFYGGIIDTTYQNNFGGIYQNFVNWENEDTVHHISLITTNSWGCQSHINIDTVYEPQIPSFDVTISPDTCNLDRGAIVFSDTLEITSFFWTDTSAGPVIGMPITSVYNIPAGDYNIRKTYLTENIAYYAYYIITFGTATCIDTLSYTIDTGPSITANFSIDLSINTFEVNDIIFFDNNTISDFESTITTWYFGDGTSIINSDPIVEHIYTQAGCYDTYIEVSTDEIPACIDTYTPTYCILIDPIPEPDSTYYSYPNPASDFFQINLPNYEQVNIVIFNSFGNIVMEIINYVGEEIPSTNLGSGIYQIRIENNEEYFYTNIFIP